MSYLSLKEGADLGNFISTCDAAAARTIGLHLLFFMHRDCIQNQQGIAEAQGELLETYINMIHWYLRNMRQRGRGNRLSWSYVQLLLVMACPVVHCGSLIGRISSLLCWLH